MFKSMAVVVVLLTLMLATDNRQTAFALVLTEVNNNNLNHDVKQIDDLSLVDVFEETNFIKSKRFETQQKDDVESDDDNHSDAGSDYSDSEDDDDDDGDSDIDDEDDDEEFDIGKYKVYHGRSRRQLQSGPPGFSINLVFASKVTKAQKQGFLAARNQWQSIIAEDLASIACVTKNQRLCGKKFKKRTCIDDLMILVRIRKMDGVGKILGSAGPCGMSMGQVRLGVMTFDKADANMLIKRKLWLPTVMHEMGHVLGIGTLWEMYGVISPVEQGKPYLYLGPNGNAGLKQIQPAANNIIIEDEGGAGTARGHWKEAVYENELMTGYIEPSGSMPLSIFSIRSLQDLGYVVDVSKAEAYALAGRRLRNNNNDNEENRLVVGDDILKMDLVELEDAQVKNGREKQFEELKKKHEKRRQNKNN